MNLYTQVALGIDELHEQGQLALVFLVDCLTQDGIGGFADGRGQTSARERAVADDAGAGGYSADLPTLAYGLIGRYQTFIQPELVTTPDNGMQIGFKQ